MYAIERNVLKHLFLEIFLNKTSCYESVEACGCLSFYFEKYSFEIVLHLFFPAQRRKMKATDHRYRLYITGFAIFFSTLTSCSGENILMVIL